jgi:Rrf2 family protein
MLITRQADYGIRVLLYLSQVPPGRVVPMKEVARKAYIPVSFMPKIISHLTNRGLIVTERGKSGGIRLAKPPQEITIYEIVEAIDGPPLLNICMARPEECPLNPRCGVYLMWKKAQDSLDTFLKETTLDQVNKDQDGRGNPFAPHGEGES